MLEAAQERSTNRPLTRLITRQLMLIWHHRQMPFLVVTAIVRRDGEILLIRQQAPHGEESYWFLPGGAVEDDELVREAQLRELREETGLVAKELGALAWISHVRRPDDSYCMKIILTHTGCSLRGDKEEKRRGTPKECLFSFYALEAA